MPDIRLYQHGSPYQYRIDWVLLSDGTLDTTDALATAVTMALGTDRLALPSDLLPDPDSNDRMGWWGDLDADQIWGGWPVGSRLWLLARSKIVGTEARGGATVTLVEQYIREALHPFLDLKIASQLEVRAVRVGMERIDALIRLYRGPSLEVELRYQVLWNEMIEQVAASSRQLIG
jgi:phage gp46-like protein